MIIAKCVVILTLVYLAIGVAASEKEILVRIRPITRKQYESIMNMNNMKPMMPEGRLIGSAITGLAGLATGLKISNFLPNIFGTSNQNSKGSDLLGGYPLCTIDTNAATGRQSDAYLNIDQITNTLAQSSGNTNNLPVLNCILVLDDSKEKPQIEQPEESEKPEEPEEPASKPPTMKPPAYKPHTTYPHPPVNRPPYHPPSSSIPYPLFYPSYPFYPYSPVAYPPPPPPVYPMPHPPYIKYPAYEKEGGTKDDRKSPSSDTAIDLQTLIRNKIQAIHDLSTTTTTTKKPSRKLSRRPAFRSRSRSPNRSIHRSPQSKSQRNKFNEDLNEYDESIDYIEVSKSF